MVPAFTMCRSTREMPSFVPAASPRLRRRPSPWPPHRRNFPASELTAHPSDHALHPGPYPPGWSRLVAYGTSTLVSLVHLLVSLAGPAPSGSTGTSRRCQGCSHPPRRLPGQTALSFNPAAATARRRSPLTPARSHRASRRTVSSTNHRSPGKCRHGRAASMNSGVNRCTQR
jgi:hypothetical protein